MQGRLLTILLAPGFFAPSGHAAAQNRFHLANATGQTIESVHVCPTA